MKRISTLLSAFAFIALPAKAAHAQQKAETKIDGTYVFTQKIVTSPDAEAIDAQATLVITVKGDSAIATWHLAVPGRETKPSNLRGTIKGNVVTLISEVSQAHLRGGSGDERSIDVHQEYIPTITGDDIGGTINAYSSDESVTLPSREISGKRTTG